MRPIIVNALEPPSGAEHSAVRREDFSDRPALDLSDTEAVLIALQSEITTWKEAVPRHAAQAAVFALQCAAVSRLGLLCADDKAALAHNLSRVGGEAVSVEALERCISKVRRPRPGMVALS